MTDILHARTRPLVAGVVLMALALWGATVALAPALADDIGGDEGGGQADPMTVDAEEQELEVTESALYAHPLTDALPPILTESVPPQVVCVVFPELCPEELRPVTDSVGTGIDTAKEEAPVSPVHPVPPDAVAVGYFGGFDRYESAVKFELPPIPDGEEVVAFQVSFPQEDISWDVNSPSFRTFVQSVMVAIGDQDPSVVADRLPETLEAGPLEVDSDMLRMEACPLTEPFEPSETPQAQHADDMPREEGFDGEPGPVAIDCMLGGSGSFDEESERWVFDLAFAADAWAQGELNNHGILISPIGAQNVAYGDPDLSMNGQINLDTEDVTVAMETAEPPPPVGDLDPPQTMDAEPMGGEEMAADSGGFDEAPADDFDSGGGAADAPAVADDGGAVSDQPVDEPTVADDEPQVEQAAPAGSEPTTPWWVWLLVPAFAGGAYLVGNALTASPLAAAGGVDRPGAMSRLIASRTGGATPV